MTYYSAWHAMRDLMSTEALRKLLADERVGVRLAALFALLEDGAMKKEEVEALVKDTDMKVAGAAALWIENVTNANSKVEVKGTGIVKANVEAIKGTPPEMKPPAKPTTVEAAMALLSSADAGRGRMLVLHPSGAGCVACHNIGGCGNHFGPDLTGIGGRAEAQHLMQSLIDPSAVITEGFNSHVITTVRGVQSGVLLEESGLAVTLGLPTGQRERIMRSDITKQETLPISAMPPFGALLNAQQCADVVAWLLTQK